MLMSRFYVNPASVLGKKIYAEGEVGHHIIDVMRLGEGDSVTVFDGTGKEYKGTIASTGNKRVVIDILEINTTEKDSIVNISLAQAIPKKDKMDMIIQKATELGAVEILPFESSRTIVRARGERRQRKIERWRKIALEASKQCGRAELPKVADVVRFEAVLGLLPEYDLAVMPCLSGESIPLKSALRNVNKPKKVLAIIGPEGGFTEDEIEKAGGKGAVLVSLGGLVLRSDTAAIATLSILNHVL